MGRPNANLWSVTVRVGRYGREDHLWILAATAETATSKARRFMRARGEGFKILKVESEGTIDVF